MVMTTKQFPKKISLINAATRLIKHQSSQKRSNFCQAKGARQKNVVFFSRHSTFISVVSTEETVF